MERFGLKAMRVRVRLRHAFWTGLLVGVLGTFLALTPVGTAIETDLGLQWLFSLRGTVQPPDEAVVVSVGESALDRLAHKTDDATMKRCIEQTRSYRRGVWPRCLYARLIARLTALGARVIALDVYFVAPGARDEDLLLQRAIANSGRVLLLQRTSLGYDQNRSIRVQTLVSPLSQFATAAFGTGPFPLPKVPARVDQFWVFKDISGIVPTLPALVLQVYADGALDTLLQALGHPASLRPSGRGGGETVLNGSTTLAQTMVSVRSLVQSHLEAAKPIPLADDDTAAGDSGRQGLARALLRLYAGGDSRYLNLYGPAGTLPIIPADRLLVPQSGADPLEAELRGKAVFIGLAEHDRVEQEDDFHTVFSQPDGTYLSGVEIAATAFLNLLHDRSLVPLNNLLIAVLTCAFGIAMTLLVYALPVPLGLAACLLVASAYGGAAFQIFAAHALWLPLVTPLALELPLGVSAGLFLHYRSERNLRYRAHEALRGYLPEIASENLIRSGAAAAPTEIVRAICLATDIEQFTALVERTALEMLTPLMNQYMEPLNDAVSRHGGYVVDVHGDSLMCVWRDENPDLEVRKRACLAALEVNRAVEDYNRSHAAYRMPTRIGLDAGEVMLGTIGGKRRLAYTVGGDPANTSSRIENLNKFLGTRILASAGVVAGVDAIASRRVGTYLLVGKSNPTDIYELIGAAATPEDDALCQSFAAALAAFESCDWPDAATRLEAHGHRHPDDGVARYLLVLSRKFLLQPPVYPDPWIIRMTQK